MWVILYSGVVLDGFSVVTSINNDPSIAGPFPPTFEDTCSRESQEKPFANSWESGATLVTLVKSNAAMNVQGIGLKNVGAETQL